MLLYILGLALLVLLAIILNDPIDPDELARFYAPRKIINWDRREIIAPPMITGPSEIREAYIKKSTKELLPDRRVTKTNGHTIYEGLPQISVPIRKVSGYVDGDMDGILPPYHIHESNGYKIIEGFPEIAVPNQKYFP